MSKRKEPQNKDASAWLLGLMLVGVAILAFLELNFEAFVFLLIIGVGFMAYESEKFRGELFSLFFNILKGILKRIGLLEE